MTRPPQLLAAACAFAVCLAAAADIHTSEALRHATEAVRAGRDAKSVGEQATLALQHVEAAKADKENFPELLKQLTLGGEDLKSAIRNASLFNTERAAHDAADAEVHLRAADTAARRLDAMKARSRLSAPR